MGAFINSRWPSGIVPYVVDANFADWPDLRLALETLEKKTNLRFVRRQPTQDDFVLVMNFGKDCTSPVGRQGGVQAIRCTERYGSGSVMHEFCHAIGMIHEQSRSDRNNFVAIDFDRVEDGGEHNFERHGDSRNRTEYDFKSLMHYSADAFSKDKQAVITPKDPANVISPSSSPTADDITAIQTEYPHLGVVRRSDAEGASGRIGELSAVTRGDARFVAAVRDGDGDLKLIEYEVFAGGGVERRGTSGSAPGHATHISLAAAGVTDRVVTAFRDGDGDLKLVSWRVIDDDVIDRLDDSGSAAGDASLIRILSIDSELFVVACRTGAGDLKLITWRVDGAGNIRRLNDSGDSAGAVSEIALSEVRRSSGSVQVASTVRDGSGRAKVIVWSISARDGEVQRLGDSGNQFGAATRMTTAMAHTDVLAVACRTAGDDLRVITLSISADGRRIARVDDTADRAGVASRIAIASRPYGVVTAVRGGDSRLKLIKWAVDGAGDIRRIGDSADQAGRIGELDLVAVAHDDAPIVTPISTVNGLLDAITWDDLSDTGELNR